MYKKFLILAMLPTLSSGVMAQIVSYNQNSIPITGTENTAFGWHVLDSNSTGSINTGIGYNALFSNKSGSYNVALGGHSLFSNTTGSANVAIGKDALYGNTTGGRNVANGQQSLLYNTTGRENIAIGMWTLVYNTTGNDNVAMGHQALSFISSGDNNTAIGAFTLLTNDTGNNNTGLGNSSDVSTKNLTNATAVGYATIVNASNKVRIGNSSVTVVEGPVAYTVSDARFKTNIREDDVKGLEFIKRLRPVVYNFDTKKFEEFLVKNMPDSIRQKHMDQDFASSTAIRQSGFIAQEVEKTAQEVGYTFNGVHKPINDNDNYSLAYGQFVVPLVKGMQEQQHMIDELKNANTALQNGMEEQKRTNENLQQQLDDLKRLLTPNGRGSNMLNTPKIAQQNITLSDGSAIVLNQNAPNPFAETTVITYSIPDGFKKAQILFTTLDGIIIRTVDITVKGKGQLNVFADDLTSGVYKYSLVVDGKTIDAKSMVKQ